MTLKLIVAAAALAFAGTAAHAADKMDCCKDGKCACCAKKPGDGDKPHGDMKH